MGQGAGQLEVVATQPSRPYTVASPEEQLTEAWTRLRQAADAPPAPPEPVSEPAASLTLAPSAARLLPSPAPRGVSTRAPPPITASGRAGSPSARAAAAALAAVPPAGPELPAVRYVQALRAELSRRNLPTAAPGVRMYVAGEAGEAAGEGAHVRTILGLVAGEHGIAPGGDVRLFDLAQDPEQGPAAAANRFNAALWQVEAARLGTGDIDLDGLADLVLLRLAYYVDMRRRSLRAVRAEVEREQHRGPTLVSMSWNMSALFDLAWNKLPTIAAMPRDTRLHRALAEQLGPAPEIAARGEAPEAWRCAVAHLLLARVEGRAANSPGRAALSEAIASLERELALGRQRDILAFAAAGNDGQLASYLGLGAEHIRTADFAAKGLVTVAALDLGRVDDPSDDRVGPGSSPGHVAAIGVGIPNGAMAVAGTSFAGPFMMGTAALMAAANPGLSADGIEALLLSPPVARDIPDDSRDGHGGVDVVAAVEAAARAPQRQPRR